MRRKAFNFLLFTLFAVNCMAFNLSADTSKTSKKADNPLIEDGYDLDADTVMGYYGKPIQHLTSFTNNLGVLHQTAGRAFIHGRGLRYLTSM